MNEKLLKKLLNEEPLDASEHLELERILEEGDNSFVAQFLGSQDHVEPSLAWRSNLNEELRQIAPQPKAPLFKWIGIGGAVAAMAAGCAFLAFSVLETKSEQPGASKTVAQKHQNQIVPPDSVSGESELSELLVNAHQSDRTQSSLGVRSPRAAMRPASSQLGDISKW